MHGVVAVDRLQQGAKLPRHRHVEPYVAIVLAGGYSEAGDTGRYCVGPGDAIVHRPYEAHRNSAGPGGAQILNLPLPETLRLRPLCRVSDPDEIARLAARDILEAVAAFGEGATCREGSDFDWPDLLAADLLRGEDFCLTDWARRRDLAPGSVSRGFARVYGVSPQRYRAEARARRAYRMLRESKDTLGAVAAELGFADQAHMSRALRAITGRTPLCCRREPSCLPAQLSASPALP